MSLRLERGSFLEQVVEEDPRLNQIAKKWTLNGNTDTRLMASFQDILG